MVRRLLFSSMLGVVVVLIVVGVAMAADPHSGSTGQPGQTCQLLGSPPPTPGKAASAPGSAFNPTGVAGGVYAGTQPQNSKNPKSVSQYDVACFQHS